jgi:hypothetical protein
MWNIGSLLNGGRQAKSTWKSVLDERGKTIKREAKITMRNFIAW